MSTEQIRKDFEEWMGDGGLSPRAIERNSKGDYILMQAASAWEVWKAAHTHYAKPAAPVVWPEPFGYFKPFVDGWMDCKETDEGARPLYEAPQPKAVPSFNYVAAKKLKELQARGYTVAGYSIEKTSESGAVKRGFITSGGFVGWWQGQHTNQQPQADTRDAERYRWLRDQGSLAEGSRHPQSWRCVAMLADMGGEHADTAIDAAIAAAKENT